MEEESPSPVTIWTQSALLPPPRTQGREEELTQNQQSLLPSLKNALPIGEDLRRIVVSYLKSSLPRTRAVWQPRKKIPGDCCCVWRFRESSNKWNERTPKCIWSPLRCLFCLLVGCYAFLTSWYCIICVPFLVCLACMQDCFQKCECQCCCRDYCPLSRQSPDKKNNISLLCDDLSLHAGCGQVKFRIKHEFRGSLNDENENVTSSETRESMDTCFCCAGSDYCEMAYLPESDTICV